MNINVSTYPIAFRYPMEITNATSRLNKPADPSSISQFDPVMRSAEQLIKLGILCRCTLKKIQRYGFLIH